VYRIPDDDIDRSLPGSKAGSRSDTTGSSHARLASAAFLGLNSSASGNAESQGRTGTATAISSGMSDSDAVPSHTGARFANGIASGMTLTTDQAGRCEQSAVRRARPMSSVGGQLARMRRRILRWELQLTT